MPLQKIKVVGHDIGLVVACAYAAMYPSETTKLVVMDAFLPGVAGWEAIYNEARIWHFRFNGTTPKHWSVGRERIFFEYFWNDLAADKTRSLAGTDTRYFDPANEPKPRQKSNSSLFVPR